MLSRESSEGMLRNGVATNTVIPPLQPSKDEKGSQAGAGGEAVLRCPHIPTWIQSREKSRLQGWLLKRHTFNEPMCNYFLDP